MTYAIEVKADPNKPAPHGRDWIRGDGRHSYPEACRKAGFIKSISTCSVRVVEAD